MQAKPLPLCPEVIKIVRAKGTSWETPRTPFEVTFEAAVSPSHPSFEALDASLTWQEHTVTLGQKRLPDRVEAALASMAESESAVFVMRTDFLTPTADDALPRFPVVADSSQHVWHLHLRMLSFVEVRDMTGDGRVCACRISFLGVQAPYLLLRRSQRVARARVPRGHFQD